MVWIRSLKPRFIKNDREYAIPVRFSEELAHNLMTGWHPIGFGWGHLRPHGDGSFDLWIRTAELSEDMNLVRLDFVQNALMAALDLSNSILENDEEEYDDDTVEAAERIKDLVKIIG